jgi:hypothetical protein
MADTKASQAGRELVRARWGNQVVSRAVSVVVERRGELTAEQRAELRAVAEQEEAPGE